MTAVKVFCPLTLVTAHCSNHKIINRNFTTAQTLTQTIRTWSFVAFTVESILKRRVHFQFPPHPRQIMPWISD